MTALDAFEDTALIILPVIICLAAGFSFALLGIPFDRKIVGNVAVKIGYPALIFSHIAEYKVEVEPFLMLMGVSAVIMLLFGLFGYIFLKAVGWSPQVYLALMMFANFSFLGIPVAALAFGHEGTTAALAFLAATFLLLFTLGRVVTTGSFDFRDLTRQPSLYAVVAALLFMYLGLSLPKPIEQAADILGGLPIPLMLLVFGHGLASLKITTYLKPSILTGFHILVAAAIAYIISVSFSLPPNAMKTLIMLCFMSPSLTMYVWIEQIAPEHTEEVASFIGLSQFASIITVSTALVLLA